MTKPNPNPTKPGAPPPPRKPQQPGWMQGPRPPRGYTTRQLSPRQRGIRGRGR